MFWLRNKKIISQYALLSGGLVVGTPNNRLNDMVILCTKTNVKTDGEGNVDTFTINF